MVDAALTFSGNDGTDRRQARLGIAALWVAVLLSACTSAPQPESTLYRSSGTGLEARLSTLERQVRTLSSQITDSQRTIAELDGLLVRLKRDMTEDAQAHESLRTEAATGRASLADRIARLESQLETVNSERTAITQRLDALRSVAGKAMEEAQRARLLINLEEAERAGMSVPSETAETPSGSAGADGGTSEPSAASSAERSETVFSEEDLPPGGFAVHLASYQSEETALAGWREIKASHPELLTSREARLKLLDLGEFGGRYLRLLVGPFEDVAPARKVCARLRASGEFCQVAAFGGAPVESSAP